AEAGVTRALSQLRSDLVRHPAEGDVLVVPGLRLGGGREDRLRPLLTLAQSGRQRLSLHRALLSILSPGAAGEVSAHHALEIDALGAADDHRAAVLPALKEVVLLQLRGALEPEGRELRQHPAPVRDACQ